MRTYPFIRSCVFIVLLWPRIYSASPEKAFEALHMYDYFKARQLFYRNYTKQPEAASAYGLAIIYSRNDNPFHQTDSAVKYSQTALLLYTKKPVKESYSGFTVSDSTLQSLLVSVSEQCFKNSKTAQSVSGWEHFLTWNFLAPLHLKKEAVFLRDELEFNRVFSRNSSDSSMAFLLTHPQSSFRMEALILLDRQLYEEATPHKSPGEFIRFLDRSPESAMRTTALDNLYRIYCQHSDVEGLKRFVYSYPDAPQCREAWKLFFSLSVKSYSDEELIRFLAQYPEFPLKSSILTELQFSALQLLPFKSGDLSGYLDTSGQIKILPVYDSVSAFHEGLAVVSRNDSVWYINKLNEFVFAQVYNEALPFHSGAAAVKINATWKFINRQGQSISPDYEEINELSEGVYVVKTAGKYGALNEFGQTLLEAKFDYLSNFSNGAAVYRENEKYGFVTTQAFQYKAEMDWISDFEENGLALFKMKNHYGLIDKKGKAVLPADYDQVLPINRNHYLLVNNNFYGFYDASGCFISPLIYDYQKGKPADYYAKDNWFRLIKNNTMALMDANGVIRVNFGVYEDCGFFSEGLLRVKKKSRTGFVDRRLQSVIPLKYDWASDCLDSLILVRKAQDYELIDIFGKSRFKSPSPVQRIGKYYFLVLKDGYRQLLNRKGELVFDQVLQIQALGPDYTGIVLKNQEIKLLKVETLVNLGTNSKP